MRAVVTLLTAAILLAARTASCSPAAMKGPPRHVPHDHAAAAEPDPSPLTAIFTGAIVFYRSVISPTQAPRCGFYPSCSAFGLQAVRDQGPLRGVLMTADRLTRCNLLKGPGPDYYLLPNGRLLDPVSMNLLQEP